MEMVLSSGFCEISQEEELKTDGGCLVELAVGLTVLTIAVIVGVDMNNAYRNGYNDVMSSVGSNGTVSGGDAR